MNREIRYQVWQEFPKYEVGDNGTVFSLDYNHTGKRAELKQSSDKDGYRYVFLVVNGKRYKRLVHRMVATCFIGNPESKPQVNHKNGIRNDNDIFNLEWVTSQENTIHGYMVNGRKASDKSRILAKERFSGVNNPKAKITFGIAECIRTERAIGATLKELSEAYQISMGQVSSICQYKHWATPTPNS